MSRRSFLASGTGVALAAGVVGSGVLTEGCGVVPASNRSEPPLTHYAMPYASTPLVSGSDLQGVYDELGMLAALQGIVNRDQPRLYLLGVSHGGSGDLDQFWWDIMASLGWSVAKSEPYLAKDLNDLLAIYGHRTKGLVVWDPAVPATANVAATIAGVHDLLPVAYRTASGSLYQQLRKAGWGVGAWLIKQDGAPLFTGVGVIPGTKLASSGSAKNDAYRWAKAHYLDTGLTRADLMAYTIDSYWLQVASAGSFWNNTLVNHDYYVANGGFFFDLDPWTDEVPADDPHQKAGTDAATLKELLASANQRTGGKHMINVGGFIPWAYKYTNYGRAGGTHAPVPTEWEYAQILSWYNAFMEADAIGYCAIANASFTQHMPLDATYPQPAAPDSSVLQAQGLLNPDGTVPAKRYFAFYVGDFDSPAWLYQAMPSLWNDPARGTVPLSWAFDPNLALRAGPAMAWTRKTRSPKDTFVAGDSGAGYLNPGALREPRPSGLPSGMATWAAHCARMYTQWDIAVTGFIIEGDSPGMDVSGLQAYAGFSPGGIVGQKVPNMSLINTTPTLAMGPDIGGSEASAASSVEGMFRQVLAPQFGVARGILEKPSWYRGVADLLEAQGIVVVDLVTLCALAAAYMQAPPTETVVARPTLRVGGTGMQLAGMRVVPAPDANYQVGTAGGQSAIVFQGATTGSLSYLYLTVDRAGPLLSGQPKTLWAQVQYYDFPTGLQLHCDYGSQGGGATTPTTTVTTAGTLVWKTAVWQLADADFAGKQEEGADLRIAASPDLAIRQVLLSATALSG